MSLEAGFSRNALMLFSAKDSGESSNYITIKEEKSVTSKRSSRLGTVGALAAVMVFLLTGCSPQYVVFHPAGPVASQELHLIILSAILVAIVIIPVLILLAIIVYRFRDKPGNKAPYQPEWKDSKVLEVVWWGIPVVIIGILGAFTAKTTFALTKPPETNVPPITIDVTSLDYKWLFEYPGQNIATVNYVNIPQGVPVQFVLTADAPMNSFWVPQLGGQEYTMPGMAMRLWLQADKVGQYQGYGANFSGEGFAHMTFTVNSKTQSDFNTWVNQVKATQPKLTEVAYNQLVKPSIVGQSTYSSYPAGLFDKVIAKNSGGSMSGMNMSGVTAGSNTTSSTGSSGNTSSMDMSNMNGNN